MHKYSSNNKSYERVRVRNVERPVINDYYISSFIKPVVEYENGHWRMNKSYYNNYAPINDTAHKNSRQDNNNNIIIVVFIFSRKI